MSSLVDTPEKIWHSLDCGHLLEATHYYSQAARVHHRLRAVPDLERTVPLLKRQWETVNHFPAKIRSFARHQLHLGGLSSQRYAEALYAMIVLDSSLSPFQSIREFLNARRTYIADLLADPPLRAAASGVCVCVCVSVRQAGRVW
jgi:hypothetical protein